MISERLTVELSKSFANRGLRLHVGQRPVASFPPVHAAWNSIDICDDGDEVTAYFGPFTHAHFGNYDEGITTEQRAVRIVSDVVAFLDDVFSDKIEFYKTKSGGGCRRRGEQGDCSRQTVQGRCYVWSGPVAGDDGAFGP